MTKNEIIKNFWNVINKGKRLSISERWFCNNYGDAYADFLTWSFPDDFSFQQRIYHYLYDDPQLQLGLCPVCGRRCKFRSFKRGYLKHCSSKCSNSDTFKIQKYKDTCLSRFGVDNVAKSDTVKERQKDTCLKKYGIEWPAQMDITKEKYAKTCFEKYGFAHPMKNKTINAKKLNTMVEKYGVEYPLQSDTIKEKLKQTNISRYGVENATSSDTIKSKVKENNIRKYGVPYTCMLSNARQYSNDSKPNLDFARLLEKHGISYTREFPLDKYIFDFKVNDDILVEINPTITHNSTINIFGGTPKDRLYHYDKSKTAAEHGYTCICVWDWSDMDAVVDCLKNGKRVISMVADCPNRHWHNIKTHEHVADSEKTDEQLVSEGFLLVWDDGNDIRFE